MKSDSEGRLYFNRTGPGAAGASVIASADQPASAKISLVGGTHCYISAVEKNRNADWTSTGLSVAIQFPSNVSDAPSYQEAAPVKWGGKTLLAHQPQINSEGLEESPDHGDAQPVTTATVRNESADAARVDRSRRRMQQGRRSLAGKPTAMKPVGNACDGGMTLFSTGAVTLPADYGKDSCAWTLVCTNNKVPKVTFSEFYTRAQDLLSAHEAGPTGTQIDSLSGNKESGTVIQGPDTQSKSGKDTTGTVTLTFKSKDESSSTGGFKGTFECVEKAFVSSSAGAMQNERTAVGTDGSNAFSLSSKSNSKLG